jgi:IS605 OrfB family transposase
MGIDLNPGLIGWAIADREGNLKVKGQIRVNLQDLSSEQTKATLGDAVKQLVDIASEYGCPIAVETLDFSKKKTSMKQQGVRYSRMLSNFAYSKFFEMLNSRAERTGIEVVKLNAAYSSLIGLGKFMAQYGLSSDTAAGFVLARRALRKSERIPANLARLLPEDRSRHSWSYWNALNKKLCGLRRHDFFNLSAANRGVVVTLPDELDSSSRSGGKPKSTSTGGRDSHPLADNTARSVPDSLQLCRDLSGF